MKRHPKPLSATNPRVSTCHRFLGAFRGRGGAGKRIGRAAACLGAALLSLELLYILLANVLLASGAIQRAASASPDNTEMAWTRAFSPWPGRAYLWGFRLSVQDPLIEFRLAVDHAKLDVVLRDLFRRKFHATSVRAEGVSYRFITKVEGTAGNEGRLAAFPMLEGFSRPALRSNPMPPPATAAEARELWGAQLDDVDATLTELWFMEYRYRGHGRLRGAFALAPLRTLWVGPALLQLEGGELSAGEHLISSSFVGSARVRIAPIDLPSSPGLRVLHTLTASVRFDTSLADLGAADLYLDGLRARGKGRLTADLELADGKLMPGSSLDATLSSADVQLAGYRFTGATQVTLSVSEGAQVPIARSTASGILRMPLGEGEPTIAALSGLTGALVFMDNDLSHGLQFRRLSAVLGEARVSDARTIARAVSAQVPLFAPAVLGSGPLVASGSASATPGYAIVRLKHLQLGDGDLEGAAFAGGNGWRGAGLGHFGQIPLGLRLLNRRIESMPFTPHPWLSAELRRVGIQPEYAPGRNEREER
jgi:hypothetical protein